MSLPETIDLGDGFVLEQARVTTQRSAAQFAKASSTRALHAVGDAGTGDGGGAARTIRPSRGRVAASTRFDCIVRRPANRQVLGSVGLGWSHPNGLAAARSRSGTGSTWTGATVGWRAAPRAAHESGVQPRRGGTGRDPLRVTNLASAAVPRKLGFAVDGIVDARRRAPSDSGQDMVWLRKRTADDAVPFETSPNRRITRIGDTVHRPSSGDARGNELLRYLEAAGFDGSPRVLGSTTRVARYSRSSLAIPARAAGRTSCRTTAGRVRGLMRRYHDAVRSYLPPPNAYVGRVHHRSTGTRATWCATATAVRGMSYGATAARWRSSTLTTPGPRPPLDDVAYALRVHRPLPRRCRMPPLAPVQRAPGSPPTDGGLRRGVRAPPQNDAQRAGRSAGQPFEGSSGAKCSRRCAPLHGRAWSPRPRGWRTAMDDELSARVRWSEENRHLFPDSRRVRMRLEQLTLDTLDPDQQALYDTIVGSRPGDAPRPHRRRGGQSRARSTRCSTIPRRAAPAGARWDAPLPRSALRRRARARHPHRGGGLGKRVRVVGARPHRKAGRPHRR